MTSGSLPGVREAFLKLDRLSRKSKMRDWAAEREVRSAFSVRLKMADCLYVKAKRAGIPALGQ